MTKYIAFLRAINVSGHNIIRMADLKRMFESVGLENVQTFIQSGNVVFESSEKDTASLEKRIESQLEKASGYKIRLFVRTMRELQSIVSKSPFEPKTDEMAYVAFLNQKPDKEQGQVLMSFKSEGDDFAVKGREVYILRRNREKSVFSNNFIEKILKLPATTRNLTTIRKITEKYT
ncbi:MAG: DUF1697 domain-containing protein [Anaerolineales bacterium]|nr:DUF1697 domain-containing protein [Anaerolineales bacterium]